MLVALGAWFILREKLSHLAVGRHAGDHRRHHRHWRSVPARPPAARALLYGLATMVLFGITNFLLKYAGHHGSDSVTITTILWLSSGVCGVLAIGYCLIRYGHLPGMQQPSLILWAVLAGARAGAGDAVPQAGGDQGTRRSGHRHHWIQLHPGGAV